MGEETVTACKSNSVAKDSSTDGVPYAYQVSQTSSGNKLNKPTWTEPRTVNQRFYFFRLQSYIQFQVVDVPVELLRGVSNLRVRIPVQEAFVG